MAGRIPDRVEVYRSKIFPWMYLTANYYKDIPDKMNVYIQDNEGVIHGYKIMTVLDLEKRIRDEHWIFVETQKNKWFDPCLLRMEEK